MKGSPSEKAGLKAGDKILFVNRIAVSGANISHLELTNLVRGPEKGTPVIATIGRVGTKDNFNLQIIRDKIQSRSVDFTDMPVQGIGYIKCSRFTPQYSVRNERGHYEPHFQGNEILGSGSA